jgi:integrase
MSERKGYVGQDKNGKWFARTTVTDGNGKRRNIKRRGKDKADAKAILKSLIRQLEDEGEKGIEASRMTFNDLADFYTKHYLNPAEYRDGRKISGLRDLIKPKSCVNRFRAYFGRKRLREITYGDVYSYRAERFKAKTQFKRPPSISTMNRELVVLRRMFNIAMQNGWLIRNPFKAGDALISPSDERRREKILSFSEEVKLLAVCTGPRKHLKPLLIALLDTGCRRGEMFKLCWRSVCFASRTITIEALNTKTLRRRQVAMTQRLYDELVNLWEESTQDLDTLVFGLTNNVRRSFMAVCKLAGIKHGGIDGLTIHSLRHTAATRLVQGQMPLQMVGRILGHTQPQTTYRYLSASAETAAQAAAILEAFQTQTTSTEAPELIN